MKKLTLKSLALALTLTLVLTTCLLGGAMVVSAADDYTVTTTTGSTSDPIDTSNLLYGINPQENTTVTRWTDGENSCLPASMTKLSFQLNNSTTINTVKVTSQNGYGSGATRLGSYDIYIADSYSELYNEENKVATFSSDSTSVGYRTEIDTFQFGSEYAKTGKFVGFNITKTDNQGNNKIYINEIEVFGVEILPDYTLTTTTGSTSDTYDTSENLIYGKESLSFPGTHFAQLTDGNRKPISVGSASSAWPLKFSYELGATYDINKVIVTSESGANRLAEYAIYVSDSKDDLFNAENQIALVSEGVSNSYSGTTTTVDTIEFKADYDTRGSFFGIAFIDPTTAADLASGKIGEIEVIGTEYVVDWTVTTATGSTSDPINTDSLIYGKLTEEFGSNVLDITDGINKQRGLSSATTLTFDMGGYAKVEGVRVISQNQTSVASSRLGAYEIYVSDSLEGLYNAENKMAEIDPEATAAGWRTYVDTFAFAEHYAKTGKYIGFKILARNIADAEGFAYINEIEVTGTECPTVTATAGAGGTITPAGDTLLNGTPVDFAITADEGYKVAEVLVNGVAAELTDGKYTFAGTETGWNTISATFALIGDANNDTVLDKNDLIVIQKHLLDIETGDIKYVDVDGNGKVDIRDLVIAYDLQQGLSPAVAALKDSLGITDGEYLSAINRAKAYNTSATDTARLNAVFEKAESGHPITIAAIGGSITEGAGYNVMDGVSVSAEDLGVTVNGSTYQNSKYVDRVVNWFDAKFENSTVTKVNAGISGTPSFFGTFRLENDVLSHNPDLVIVEFSVNDLGNYQLDEGYMLDAYESVVRKCLENGSAVITVFTVNNISNNIGNSWQTYHKAIADHYNVPTISYHNAIYPNGEWITEWEKISGDNVHPNVAGHALLANCITSYLDDVYAMDAHSSTAIPAEWCHNDTFADTDIIYMGDVTFGGMNKTASSKYGYIATNTAGTGNESIVAQIPAGATEIYVFYNTIANAGDIYATLGDNTETGPYSTNVSSISYSHGEWTRIYNGEALDQDTSLTIRSADDGKALEILSILVVK